MDFSKKNKHKRMNKKNLKYYTLKIKNKIEGEV